MGILSAIPPQKKKTNKDTNKKTSRKTNKTENKNRKYTYFDSKKPSETLWRMSHNFLPCCHSLIGTLLSKTWQRGVATWLCFSLIIRHAWLQLSHVISCLCWHCGISCDIFASCFNSICLYTKKLSIFKTTSFFGVSTLKRLSYNRTSETFQIISVLYKKDMRSNWCFNHKMLLFRKFGSYFHSFNDGRNYSPFLRNETQSFFCLFFVLFQVKSRGLCTHTRP